MEMLPVGQPAPFVLDWPTNYSGLAKSTDGGETWTKLAAPRWPGDSNFIHVSVAKVDGDLYFWGVTHGTASAACS